MLFFVFKKRLFFNENVVRIVGNQEKEQNFNMCFFILFLLIKICINFTVFKNKLDTVNIAD